jgi:hypothetical protein
VEIDRIVRKQQGVVTRAQALEAGMTPSAIRHRLVSGRWQRLHAGIYLTHTGQVTWTVRASAALLHAGSGAVLGLDAAAYQLRIQARQPPVIQVFVPASRRVVAVEGVRVRRLRNLSERSVDGLRTTSVAQTVIDLTAEPGRSADDVVALVARVCQSGRVTPGGLLTELGSRRSHPHRELLQAALWDVDSGVESVAEFRFLRNVARRHGLPSPRSQTPTGDGGRRDFEFERGVIVEIDGARWHQGAQFRTDRKRDRQVARDGGVTLRAAWVDVALEPCELAVDIAMVLRRRGWQGRPVPCSPDCAVNRLDTATG